jgi:hypothetical protein
MPLPPLVGVEDVIARLPSTVTVEVPRVTALILDASAAARRISKQEFTIRQSTVGIRPIGYKLRLPQSPVISVDEISIRLPNSSTTVTIPGWYWDGSDEVWLTEGGSIINLAEELLFALEWQTPLCLTTYTHGYTETPDDVVGVVCSMVNRIITAPGLGGVISETVGEYSYRLSDAAAQGTMGLTEAETKILRSYIPRKTSTAELRG